MENTDKKMTLANLITLARIFMIPFFLVILLTKMENKEIIAFVIFLIAAVTDAVDGYLARRMNEVSSLGKFLDPMADKLLISAALIALVHLNEIETWAATIIILREIFISAFRFYFLVNEASFSASASAKWKTTLQITAVAALIIYRKLPLADHIFFAATAVLYISIVFSLWSAFQYVRQYSFFPRK